MLSKVVPGLVVAVTDELAAPVQALDQICISLVTKPILVPFLDSVTLMAATDVPMELVLIHKSPVVESHVVDPLGKGSK